MSTLTPNERKVLWRALQQAEAAVNRGAARAYDGVFDAVESIVAIHEAAAGGQR